MATTVGELFIQIGVKGADKTVVSISAVSTAIKQTASVSLEAKAAILGAMYALQQFFDKSGNAGTALANFNTLTGISSQRLQEYQYAARQMGVSNEETAATFKNLQSAMEKQVLGVSRVSTWSQLSAKLGGTLGINDVNKFAKDPALLMQKLQEYAKLEQDVAKRNETLRGFGVSDDMIAALSKGAFNQDAFAKAPKYSDREIAALDRANTAWGNLSDKIAMAVGHLNAAHGEQIVKIFTTLVSAGLRFVDVMLKITEKSRVFETLQKVFSAIVREAQYVIDPIEKVGGAIAKVVAEFSSLSGKSNVIANLGAILKSVGDSATSIINITSAIIKLVAGTQLLGTEMNAFQIVAKGLDMIFQGWAAIFRGISATLAAAAEYLNPSTQSKTAGQAPSVGEQVKEFASNSFKMIFGLDELGARSVNGVPTSAANPGQPPKLALVPPPPPIGGTAAIAAPPMPAQVVKQGGTNNMTVNQTLNFQHEGKEAQRTADSIEKAAGRAMKTMKVTQVN